MATYDLGQLGEVSGAFEALDASLDVLKMWLPVAVQKANLAGYLEDDGHLAQPKFYGRLSPSVVERVGDQIPAVMVSSPGTTRTPIKVGMTGWSAYYTVQVTVVDRGQTFEQTGNRVQLWAGLVRQVMLGNRSLRGRVQDVAWDGETFGPIPDLAGRTYAGCTVTFTVQLPVTDVGDLGPLIPDPVYPDPTTGLPNPLPDTPTVVSFQEEKA